MHVQAEEKLLGKGNKEYLPIQGLAAFNKATADLLLGPDNAAIKEVRSAEPPGSQDYDLPSFTAVDRVDFTTCCWQACGHTVSVHSPDATGALFILPPNGKLDSPSIPLLAHIEA